MAEDIALQLAETVQTAHLEHDPDTNPPTAADTLTVHSIEEDASDDDADIPLSVLRPPPAAAAGQHGGRIRHNPFAQHGAAPQVYPMPDLRFEQSYLRSIESADTWWKVTWITVLHQVVMPLVQGVGYNLVVLGWRHWGRNVQLHGTSVGARTRRWWWGVNNWKIPPTLGKKTN